VSRRLGDDHCGSTSAAKPWSIVLAGGDGERIQPLISRWLGERRPKQYCNFLGSRSLLQHTVDRADALTPPLRRLVVAAPHHERYLREQMRGREGGRILFQPKNCGTAPGIFLPLTYVRARDPDAMITIYPSDHFVHPEGTFTAVVARALTASAGIGGRPVVLGVEANESERDYGWIQRGQEIARAEDQPLWDVDRFIEKPGSGAVMNPKGAFWNTFVIAGRVSFLWRLGWRYVPEMMPHFARLQASVGTPEEAAVLQQIYDVMPERDFSQHILERAARHLALMNLDGVYWSDWGREQRVMESLDRLGIPSPFSKGNSAEDGTWTTYDATPEMSPS
jgi:mannose-1-phosphate guanylyltransferase